jgi:tRNA (cmo5U34)-methyltransferase
VKPTRQARAGQRLCDDHVWQTASIAERYLEGVRGAIPLAAEQIQMLLRIVHAARPTVRKVLDLGCGDGVLGRAILARHPKARGTFLDFSETMIGRAKEKFTGAPAIHEFILADYGKPTWSAALSSPRRFDVIVSGYSIHHQPDQRKKEIYAEIFGFLKTGGIFLNLEHVASESDWSGKIFDDYFIDALYEFNRRNGETQSRAALAAAYDQRPDKAANILAPVETQCHWLREVGFARVECFFKVFELALFGGVKPKGRSSRDANHSARSRRLAARG